MGQDYCFSLFNDQLIIHIMFYSHVIILGDLNTAHRPIDHWDAVNMVSLILGLRPPDCGSVQPANQCWSFGPGQLPSWKSKNSILEALRIVHSFKRHY